MKIPNKQRVMSGFRSTGSLHIGHYLGVLKSSVLLQKENDVFFMLANTQALTDNLQNPAKVRNSIPEILLDFYASGIDFDKTIVYLQSEIPEIHENFIYLSNFSCVQKLNLHPTLKTELEQKGMTGNTSLGFYIYPIHQTSDILSLNADLVPVSKDQTPMLEDAQDIAKRINTHFDKRLFVEPKPFYTLNWNLPGIDGNNKMSKSLGNSIYIHDSEEVLRSKIFSMPEYINKNNPILKYIEIFCKDSKELRKSFITRIITVSELKNILFEAINKEFIPIRERRREAESKKEILFKKVINNTPRVRKIAKQNLDAFKECMLLDFSKVDS